jgi:DNA helicase-2/ATP-dependent DNA helicase PcrA
MNTVSFQAEKGTLMTMHAAKGLEFSVVFIVGCEDGFIPFFKEKEIPNTEEGRRLFYVAMTRAKKQLYLSWARQRYRFGEKTLRNRSPFVLDIEQTLLCRQTPFSKKKNKKNQTQLKLF